MEETILNAYERPVGSKKFKEEGYIAGVIYGDTLTKALSVKFEEAYIRKILAKHGSNAKVCIKYGEKKRNGFVKDIQRHPVTAKIIHIDVQLVSKNHEIKLQIPVIYRGDEKLASKQLYLQVYKSEIDAFGKMELMPETIIVDVSEKILGDTITIKNFELDEQIKTNNTQEEIFAIVTQLREMENIDLTEETDIEPEVVTK